MRFKVFDYGVVSVALTRPLPASWDDLVTEGLRWDGDPELPIQAEGLCRHLLERLRPALSRSRTDLLSEDYLVFAITRLTDVTTADALLATHGVTIAQLLRGEREPLSPQERDDVLRQRLSYLTTDLVVPTWNAAFVYDTETGAGSALEIIEFANSQLLEFRYTTRSLMQNWPRSTTGCSSPPRCKAGSAAVLPVRRARCTRCSSTSTS